MKKRLLTAVLAVGVVLSLVGCGSQADTSTATTSTTEYVEETETATEVAEEVTEETVVEEVATTEEVVEEVIEDINPEEAPVIKEASINEMFEKVQSNDCIAQATTTKYIAGEEIYNEYLYNVVNGVYANITEDSLVYIDLINSIAYAQNEDNTGFIKVLNEERVGAIMPVVYYDFTRWLDKDFIFTEGKDSVNGEYLYAYQNFKNEDESLNYKVSFYINKETGLPFMQVITVTMPGESITLETADGTVTGDNPIVEETKYMYSYPVEGTEDFETFKEATVLPSDEECVGEIK